MLQSSYGATVKRKNYFNISFVFHVVVKKHLNCGCLELVLKKLVLVQCQGRCHFFQMISWTLWN